MKMLVSPLRSVIHSTFLSTVILLGPHNPWVLHIYSNRSFQFNPNFSNSSYKPSLVSGNVLSSTKAGI